MSGEQLQKTIWNMRHGDEFAQWIADGLVRLNTNHAQLVLEAFPEFIATYSPESTTEEEHPSLPI